MNEDVLNIINSSNFEEDFAKLFDKIFLNNEVTLSEYEVRLLRIFCFCFTSYFSRYYVGSSTTNSILERLINEARVAERKTQQT